MVFATQFASERMVPEDSLVYAAIMSLSWVTVSRPPGRD